jgi:hypothetical protein
MTHSRFLSLAACIVFALHSTAKCQEMAQINWDLAAWSDFATGEENTNSFGESQIWSAGISAARTFWNSSGHHWYSGSIQYGFSVSPLFLQLRPQSLHGIAFQPVIFRWNSIRLIGRASPYIELAGGAVHTNLNLPAGNTSAFNFTAQGGGGIYLPLGSRHACELGLRWSHISNANLGIQNPEFNGVAIRVAYHWLR